MRIPSADTVYCKRGFQRRANAIRSISSRRSRRELAPREAAERFEINVSVAVKWLQSWPRHGCVRRNRGAIAARFWKTMPIACLLS
jgi:hypothetical protein